MKRGSSISLLISLVLAGLMSCKASAPPTSHTVSPEMAAYASAVIDEFYDYDLEAVLARADVRAKANLSIDELEAFADNAHETAQPANKVKQASHYSQNNGVNLITLDYIIPNSVGHETAAVSLSYDNDVCCQLIGFSLK